MAKSPYHCPTIIICFYFVNDEQCLLGKKNNLLPILVPQICHKIVKHKQMIKKNKAICPVLTTSIFCGHIRSISWLKQGECVRIRYRFLFLSLSLRSRPGDVETDISFSDSRKILVDKISDIKSPFKPTVLYLSCLF